MYINSSLTFYDLNEESIFMSLEEYFNNEKVQSLFKLEIK